MPRHLHTLFLSLTFCFIYNFAHAAPADHKIIIVGAGVSGLAAGQELQAAGYQVSLLEADSRIGGRVNTGSIEGIPVDLGAAFIHDSEKNFLTPLTEALNIPTVPTETAGDGIEFKTQLYTVESQPFELTQSAYNRFQIVVGIAGFIASYIFPSASVEDVVYFVRNLGLLSPFTKEQVDLLIHAAAELPEAEDGDLISIKSLLSLEEVSIDRAFPGGYAQILNHYANGLDVRLNHAVTSINYDSDLITVNTTQGVFTADAVLVTVSLGVLKKGVIAFNPSLPTNKQNAINALEMGVLDKVYLKFPSVFWDSNHTIAKAQPNRGEWSVWINTNVITNEPIIQAFLSGDVARDKELLSDAEIEAQAMTELRSLYGPNIPDPTSVLVTRWHNNPLTYGSYSYGSTKDSTQLRHALAESVDNKLYFAGEATHPNNYGYVHSAIETGLREAEKIRQVYQ